MLYTEKPKAFKPDFEIVSCYIENQAGEIILLHRHPHKSQGNKWGVPAGKVESGEDLTTALLREIFEETQLEVSPDDILFYKSVYVVHPEHTFIYHMYKTQSNETPVLNDYEHQAITRISPKDALELNLVDDLDTCIRMYYKI